MTSYPDFLPVKNGILNLRSGELLTDLNEINKIDPNEIITASGALWTSLNNPTPVIDQFMNDIMLNDQQMISYLQKLLGYCITGYIVKDHQFIMLVGSGSNGKSTLMHLMSLVLGDYYGSCPRNLLVKNPMPSRELSYLMHTRVVVAEGNTDPLNESTIKSLVGGDKIFVKPLYKAPVQYVPTFKLLLMDCTQQHLDMSPALQKRTTVIPFKRAFMTPSTFDPTTNNQKLQNHNIVELLTDNLDQFLVWLVNGSVRFFQEGLEDVPK